MTPTLFRQLQDIQHQAERLTSGNPSNEELEHFSSYNEELKSYLIENIELSDVTDLVGQIPDVLDVKKEMKPKPLVSLVIFGLITIGYLHSSSTTRRTCDGRGWYRPTSNPHGVSMPASSFC